MLITETITIDSRQYLHNCSDEDKMIMQNGTGELYADALDPLDSGRTYTETAEPINPDADPTEADYAAAGKILLGEEA